MILILKKFWWLVVILLLLLFGFLAKIFKKKTDKKQSVNTKQSGTELLDRLGSVAKEDYNRYMQMALDLTHHLGTAYLWLDPRRWTENDRDVFDIIKPLSSQQLRVVADLYRSYAKGRDLYKDLSSMLDDKYYRQLTNL